MDTRWKFIDTLGSFELPNAHLNSYLYFPLVNEAGMMSALTPTLNGDAKTGQNSFLLLPTSVEDLHNSRAARNFWVQIDAARAWSATGNSAEQITRRASPADDEVSLTAGFLWHTIRRRDPASGLQAELTSFVPSGGTRLELLRVRLLNSGPSALHLTPTAAIPIYGRSADNLRDHRHVTSLLQRATCHKHGVLIRPTLSFDERGHTVNHTTYAVLGAEADGSAPLGFFADVESFIGEGGSLDWPEAVVANQPATQQTGSTVDGYEALGGLRFKDVDLAPGAQISYILILGILDDENPDALLAQYVSGFEAELQKTSAAWQARIARLRFATPDPQFDGWLQWVTLQPSLRRLMGNSFLPYHDYGRGGRGWRDLWQDILALLMMEPGDVSEMLLSNFAGVRADGSNATIIGAQPGEFKADRNGIPRVWMDHGAWPLLTTRLYIDQSGDLDFLLREQVYFKDHFSHRCQRSDPAWDAGHDTQLKTTTGETYRGSVLEHLLIQHLTAFFNVGEHNNLLLEGADWNDAFDMARKRGESVAFSALYAGNLHSLAGLCQALEQAGKHSVNLAEELLPLLDQCSGPLDYDSIAAKRDRLQAYFASTSQTLTGQKVPVRLADLARDLDVKAGWLTQHIRRQEWIQTGDGDGWFNGYYDDDGQPLEGLRAHAPRMTLTGQVFPLMCAVASDEQAGQIVRAVDKYLYDETLGGYRLNTNFGALLLNLGRAFGFAYGHKENGAMFNHMTVMYANALYKRGLAREGWKVLEGIYRQSRNFARSRMYPGIPEYFSERGRGMYTYLTGSASWYLLTMLTEVYGVRGELGDLLLAPHLTAAQFDAAGQARVQTLFAGTTLEVIYENSQRLEYGQYGIASLELNGKPLPVEGKPAQALIPRKLLAGLPGQARVHVILQ